VDSEVTDLIKDIGVLLAARHSDVPTVQTALDQLRVAVALSHKDEPPQAMTTRLGAEMEAGGMLPSDPFFTAETITALNTFVRHMRQDIQLAHDSHITDDDLRELRQVTTAAIIVLADCAICASQLRPVP
jgi:hypothetical protein